MLDALDQLDRLARPRVVLRTKRDINQYVSRRIAERPSKAAYRKPLAPLTGEEHVADWLNKCTVNRANCSEVIADVRRAYTAWCVVQGYEPITSTTKFWCVLKRLRPQVTTIWQKRERWYHVYVGIELT